MIGYIQSYDGQTLTILAPFSDTHILVKQGVTQCEIRLDDGRTISADQRKKIYATMADIAVATGNEPDVVKAVHKYYFIAKTGCHYFSLSNCDMTTANNFLQYLIEFCLEWDIPCSDNLIDRCPDIARYVYACLVRKKCCITGLKCELHHVDTVGSGRDRKTIVHEGMRVLPLSRRYHNEAHNKGNDSFCKLYHVEPVKLDKWLCEVYKLRKAT